MKSGAMYGVRGFPTTFMIDRDGIVKHKFSGARKWSSRAMRDVIDKLIK
jgi:peroxiredoxin